TTAPLLFFVGLSCIFVPHENTPSTNRCAHYRRRAHRAGLRHCGQSRGTDLPHCGTWMLGPFAIPLSAKHDILLYFRTAGNREHPFCIDQPEAEASRGSRILQAHPTTIRAEHPL